MSKRLNILYQSSNEYAMLAGVSFTSLCINANEEIDYYIYLLTPDMNDENKKKFFQVINKFPNKKLHLEFLDGNAFNEEIKNWNVPSHRGAWVTYNKLLLGRIFDENSGVEQIIHIGADTLVTGSLEGLVDFNFDGQPIAMNWSEKLYERHFPRNYKYCIAEMVYFNLPKWREHNCEERVKQHFIQIGDIYGGKDQGILNMEFQNERKQLPLEFNVYGITYYFHKHNLRRFNNATDITNEDIERAYSNPQIIHIPRTFLYRPHEEGSKEPLKEMWWYYCHESSWSDTKPYKAWPPLGAKEKFLRWMYLHLPKYFSEWFYIFCRHGYGFMNSVKCKPLKNRRICSDYMTEE